MKNESEWMDRHVHENCFAFLVIRIVFQIDENRNIIGQNKGWHERLNVHFICTKSFFAFKVENF